MDIPLLRSSFNLVVTREPELTAKFYDIFFTRYPQAQALFVRNDVAAQQKMLTDALVAVVDHLDDSPWLAKTLSGLGATHVEYGVEPVMFDWVGECLLAAMAEVAGSDWTPELADAWTEAYGAIVSLMMVGMTVSAGS